jgi:hypothetical protein
MKKITTLVIFFIQISNTFSQLNEYSFSSFASTYSEIFVGDVLGDEFTDNQNFVDVFLPGDDNVFHGNGLPIGFNFEFSGNVFDVFAVNANGWISLGHASLFPSLGVDITNDTSLMHLPLLSTEPTLSEVLISRIALFAADLQSQIGGEIRYQTLGVALNRVLVVQWKNYRKISSSGDSYNGQIRLYETTNVIELIYGTMLNDSTASGLQVGLRGAPDSTVSNFSVRTTATDWTNTTSALSAGEAITISDVVFPQSGYTFRWTPPSCYAPHSVHLLSISDTSVTVESDTNGLLWNIEVGLPGFIPGVGNQEYNASGISNNSHQVNGLMPNTHYHFYVQSDCGNGNNSIWKGPYSFLTKCMPLTSFFEDFDGLIPPVLPSCWKKISSGGVAQTDTIHSFTQPNSLYLGFGAVVALQPVNNLHSATNQLKFMARSYYNVPSQFDVGYLTDDNDPNSFVLIQTVPLPGDSFVAYSVEPQNIPPGVASLAFRNQAGWTNAFIDNISWDTIPACAPPNFLHFSVSNITATTATLEWNSNDTLWNIEVGLPGFSPGTSTQVYSAFGVANSSYMVNGLSPNTQYEFYVQTVCDTNSVSDWGGSFAFTTKCLPVTHFFEDFDGLIPPVLPSCWEKLSSGGNAHTQQNNSYSSSNCLYLTGGSILSLAPVSNLQAETHRLTFYGRTWSWYSYNGEVEVGYLTDESDPASFVLIQSLLFPNSTYVYYSIEPVNIPAGVNHIAFRKPTTSPGVLIDNVSWEMIPSCLPPHFQNYSVTNTTTTSALLGWVSNDTLWNVEVGLIGFMPGTGTQVVSVNGTTNNPCLVTGLSPSNVYHYYVQTDCGAGGLSTWAGPFLFHTECSPVSTFPYTQNFDDSFWPTCWSQEKENLANFKWSVSSTTNAGGTANEMKYDWQHGVGAARLISPQMDLSVLSNPVVEFKHFFDDYGQGAFLKLQSKTNNSAWVDESFSLASGSGNIGPVSVIVPISTTDTAVFVSWVVQGDHLMIDFWYIDNVVIREGVPAVINPDSALYDLDNVGPITVSIVWNDASNIISIIDNQAVPQVLTHNSDYIISGNNLTIQNSYLSSVLQNANDATILTIKFDVGTVHLKIVAIDTLVSAILQPIHAHYDLTIPSDISTTVVWNEANDIISIVDNRSTPFSLIENNHYTLNNNTLTISNSYLETVLLNEADQVILTVAFDTGLVATFTIDAIETPPVFVIAEWHFEDASKRYHITNHSGFISHPYTADNGVVENKNIAIIGIHNGALFFNWTEGAMGSGSYAPSSYHWDGVPHTKYWMIGISTVGYENLFFKLMKRGTDTSPQTFEMEYSTNGQSWHSFNTFMVENVWSSTGLISLPLECNNQQELRIRWMSHPFSIMGGEADSLGLNCIDDLVVSGTKITTSTHEYTNDLYIYPNPSSGQLFVETDNHGELFVFDMLGRIVFSTQINKGLNEVNINQPKGVYMIHFINEGKSQIMKLLIN